MIGIFSIEQKLERIRTEMALRGLDAYLIPRADEYLGEYVPAQNERLKWVSGFSGSAGFAIILKDRAAIFVDGRYTIQVRQQVSAELFDFCHLITEPPASWLSQILPSGSTVGLDSRTMSYRDYLLFGEVLAKQDIALAEIEPNLVDANWLDRPVPNIQHVQLLSEAFTGEHSLAKRERIGRAISESGADAALISQLDSIAWLLNIRGADVPRLPVILGFAILHRSGKLDLFADGAKLPSEFFQHVGEGVAVLGEPDLVGAISVLGSNEARLLADPATLNAWSHLRAMQSGCVLLDGVDPVLIPKAQKNATELEGIRQCHVRDGAAVSRFLAWLEQEVAAERFHDEGTLADRLEEFRRERNDLHDLSFDTISAAGVNAALCHYNHLNGIPARLKSNSLYLVDSGGQYTDGTTDITRTVAIGNPSPEHKEMFTLVLKGHIALATAVFPRGTKGVQIDVLARQFLWQRGLDYDHGTGHGVGAFLSVHEGPQRIGKTGADQEILPGMVISNEPGYYKEDAYGIRCENLVIVIQRDDGMLAFDTITLAPFDLRLIDKSLMSLDEIEWLDRYHAKVKDQLSPLLQAEDLLWLESSTRTLGT